MPADPPTPDELAALDAAVADAFEPEQIPTFQRLVDQPSYTRDRGDVEAAAEQLDTLWAGLGFDIARTPDPSGLYADHRVYRAPACEVDARAPLLVGHCDTVFPKSLGFVRFSRDPQAPDVARGPGVLDMKSGLIVQAFAVRALREALPAHFAELKLRVLVNSDEEVGSPSSAPLLAQLAPRTTEALVFEAGRDEDRVITARKGGGMFRVRAHGRAAHAGLNHASGVNAIHALALVVPQLEALTDYQAGVTVSVGIIEGGTAKNTVPDLAEAVIDARVITSAQADALEAAVRALLEAPFDAVPAAWLPGRLQETRFELLGGYTRRPMEATEASQDLRLRYEQGAAEVGLRTGEAPLQGGGSDANILADHGVPCIDGLGPFGKHFHKVEEWSSLSSQLRRTQALARFLARHAVG